MSQHLFNALRAVFLAGAENHADAHLPDNGSKGAVINFSPPRNSPSHRPGFPPPVARS
jgi:hypothetical protein